MDNKDVTHTHTYVNMDTFQICLTWKNLSKESFQRDVHCEATIVSLSNPKLTCHSVAVTSFGFITGEVNSMPVYSSVYGIVFVSYDPREQLGSTLNGWISFTFYIANSTTVSGL